MKDRLLLSIAILIVGCVLSAKADFLQNIVLAHTGDMDEALVSRVSAYLTANYECPVRLHAINPDMTGIKSADKLAGHLAELRKGNDLCVIAMAQSGDREDLSEQLYPELNVAVLNVKQSDWSAGQNTGRKERYARLVEKHCIRMVALLLGMEECPWPQCALNAEIIEQDSHMQWGRNLCPPCQYKASEIIRQQAKK